MNSRFIIIGNKFAEDPAQVRLPEHDHVVETFLSDRADQSLHVRILPWRSRCDRPVPNAHGAQTLYKKRPYEASRSRMRYRGALSHGKAFAAAADLLFGLL